MDKYNETLNYMHSLGKFSNPPHTDLRKIKYLCELFDNPQDSYKTIHIAGTNGKGSTVTMLSNILKDMGYKTGKFIGPFIEKFTERISTDESDISENDVVYYADKIKRTIEDNNVPIEFMPNEFDFYTLMAFLYYKEKGCDIAVIETGLGGTLDPTNIIKSPLVSVITSIGLDHMQVLGDTVEKIAVWKCGIIKENSPVILSPLNCESVIDIVKKTAREKNSEFIMPDIKSLKILEENIDFTRFEYKNTIYKIKLAGRHQVYNAITVIETIEHLFNDGKPPPCGHPLYSRTSFAKGAYNAVYNGIEKTFFPARFEILSRKPLVIFDGAHNISGVTALKEAIKNLLPDKKIILICGMMKEKNPEEIIKNIASESFVDRFIAVPVDSPRAETPENLCQYASKYCKNAEYSDNLFDAVKKVVDIAAGGENYAVVCFGSLYLAGDVKKILKFDYN
jgi:dihydrofolate synthase/folylpolyglutamate synthase